MAFERYRQERGVALIADRLLSLLGPWAHELNDLHLPWGRAIAELCFSLVDQLLKECAITLASSAGEAGAEAIHTVMGRRSFAGMEIEQLVEIFERLDPLLSEKWAKQDPSLPRHGRFLSSREHLLLRKLSRLNHSALPAGSGPRHKNQQALSLISAAKELCRSHLVAVARAHEAQNRLH